VLLHATAAAVFAQAIEQVISTRSLTGGASRP